MAGEFRTVSGPVWDGGAWPLVDTPTVSTSGAAGLTGGTVEISDILDQVAWNLTGPTMQTLRGTAVQVGEGKGCSAIPGRVGVSVVATLGSLPLVVTKLTCAVPLVVGGDTGTAGGSGGTSQPGGGVGTATGVPAPQRPRLQLAGGPASLRLRVRRPVGQAPRARPARARPLVRTHFGTPPA